LKIENSAYPDSSVISNNFQINVKATGCNDSSSSWSTKTINSAIVYLQSGVTTYAVLSDGTFYYTPPTLPCSLPTHEFVGTIPNGLTLEFKTGKLTVTTNSI
jgi:hypothetical protein